jgi:hypothetical protein
MKRILIIAALAMASITVTAQTNVKKTINKADMDLTAKPGENFYEYAAGSWLKSHPLDAVHQGTVLSSIWMNRTTTVFVTSSVSTQVRSCRRAL